MKGKSALIWLGLAGAAGAVLFQTSYEVQNREEQLAGLNRKIIAEQEAIQILKAEWSYLNDPSRLEAMAGTHLALRPTDARQFVASAEIIPMRPAPAPALETPVPMAGLAPQQSGVIRASAPSPAPAAAQAQTQTARVIPAVARATPAAATPAVVKSAPAAPAPAKAPAAAEPAAAKTAPKAQPAVAKQPQPLAAPPLAAPAKSLAVPASAPKAPAKTDTLGVMIARLGGVR